MTAEEVLEKAKTVLGFRIKWDRPYLIGLKHRIIDEGLQTACITKDGEIQLGRGWLEESPSEFVVSTLHHEIGHWRRRHHARGNLLMAQAAAKGVRGPLRIGGEEYSLGLAMNLGGDYAINGDVEQDGLLTVNPNWVRARDMGFDDGLCMEDYFWKLVALHEEPDGEDGDGQDGQGEEAEPGDDSGPEADGESAGESKVGEGGCGSGAGQAVEGELPSEGEPVSQVQQDIMDMKSAQEIEAAVRKNPGSVNANDRRFAAEALGHKKIPWQKKLRTVASRALSFSEGSSVDTYLQPSILQGALGFGDGVPRLPGVHRPDPRVVFAMDTSASMSAAETAMGVAQAADVMSALGAREITFMACDVEVKASVNIKSAKEIERFLVGGGGTTLRPIFDEVSKMRPRPQLLVVVTDGELGSGDVRMIAKQMPAGVRVVWLITTEADCAHFPGDVIHID